jgi:hypothetical protein
MSRPLNQVHLEDRSDLADQEGRCSGSDTRMQNTSGPSTIANPDVPVTVVSYP